jgi:hypothetical protein
MASTIGFGLVADAAMSVGRVGVGRVPGFYQASIDQEGPGAMGSDYAGWSKTRKNKLDQVHERLMMAVEGLLSGEDWVQAVRFAAEFRSRSFTNAILIRDQYAERYRAGTVSAPAPTYVAGYRQWESLGRSVAPGQPGLVVRVPVMCRLASATPDDRASWRPMGRGQSARPGEKVVSRVFGAEPGWVWDISQTHGAPIKERWDQRFPRGVTPPGLWAALVELVRAEGFWWGYDDRHAIGGGDGQTDFVSHAVTISADLGDRATVMALTHQLAHILMHAPPAGSRHVRLREIDELEADSVAVMVAAAHGMSTDGHTILDVISWSDASDRDTKAEVVQATGARVRAVALRILDQVDTFQIGAGDPPGLDLTPEPVRGALRPGDAIDPPAHGNPLAGTGLTGTGLWL